MSPTLVSQNEKDFMIESLKQGLRVDGRSLNEFRELDIELADEPGLVYVQLGKTKLSVKISGTITAPYDDKPLDGIFTINTELSALSSPLFDSTTSNSINIGNEEIVMSRILEKSIKRSGALDTESLCIIAGEKCWSIRADVHFLDFDGGSIDASCIGIITALHHFKKPEVTVSGETLVVHSIEDREPVDLALLHIPICVTFSFYNPDDTQTNIKGEINNEIIVVDATIKEQFLRKGSMTITMNKNKEICQISKSGGLSVDALSLLECTNVAFAIVETVSDKIKNVLKSSKA